jgi:endoglucanase
MIVTRVLAFVVALLTSSSAFAVSFLARPDDSASERFLATYVDGSGRVVRHDEGGDTVSEGQAYAMLIAAETGDRETFGRVWNWTQANLQRRDGLLSWHWEDGRVVDRESAADADLDAAHALAVAGARFGSDEYRAAAARLAAGIRGVEVGTVGDTPYLLPGPWANSGPPYRYNPSYVSPRAFAILGLDDIAVPRFEGAPPDWVDIARDGHMTVRRPYGYEAVRLPIRLAASRSPVHRRMAAAMWPELQRHPFTDDHPAAMVGAAAAAYAARDANAADALIAQAEESDRARPTYYGSAWLALAEVWLGLD